MSKLNKLPMALTLVGLGAAYSFAEIKLTDNLSTAGFVDMSVNGVSPDSGDATLNASLDQYEIDFMYKMGSISARADLNALPSSSTMANVLVEQAFVTYTSGQFGVNAGRFLSAMGFEAAEPTGLYQYSSSKTTGGIYGGYQNGLSLTYSTPMFALYGSVVTDLWASQEMDLKTPGFEGQVALMPMEGITAKVGYLYQVIDDSTNHDSQSLVNAWAQYAKGAITVAGEYNMLMNWQADGVNGSGWLAMANYKFATNYAATVRYSGLKLDKKDADTEVTFSPSVTLSPNLLALAEIKYEIDLKNTDYAVEATFSF